MADEQLEEERDEEQGDVLDRDPEGKEEGLGEIKRLPNPGSEMARSLGCICAVIDNNHGHYPPAPPDGWYITVGCPVHMPDRSKENGGEPF
jgi:hypothetical protein